jgi:hypothetical protein
MSRRTALVTRATSGRVKAQMPLQIVSGLPPSRKNTGLRANLSRNVTKSAATRETGCGRR